MPSDLKDLPWGNTKIRFLPRQLDEKDVTQAASLVSPSFEELKDSFIFLNKSGPVIISSIPQGDKPPIRFPVKIAYETGRIPGAMKQALEQAANFLKGRV